MSSTKCTQLTVFTLLVLICFAAPFSVAQGQRLGDLDLMAQANLSGTPMVGVEYDLDDQVSMRLALGYFQFDDTYFYSAFPCGSSPNSCVVQDDFTAYQYGGSVAGLHRLLASNGITAYTGGEVQYLYVKSSDRHWSYGRTTGDRMSLSGLLGLSIRPASWLALFGEMGVGYVRGLPVQAFRADLESSVNRWGITHLSPGLRVFL